MADEIAGVGIRVDTDGITGGIKALDVLAGQGPKVEKALQGVESTATKTGKSLATLGQGAGSDAGLAKVGKAGKDAADGVAKLGDSAGKAAAAVKQVDRAGADTARAIAGVGTAVKQLVTSNEAIVASIRGVTGAEAAYITKLNEEARQLRATIAERDKYIAQAAGMLAASREIAAAVGSQVGAMRQVQSASSQTSDSLLAITRTGVAAFLGSQVVAAAKASAAAIYEASAAGERLRTMLNFASGGNGAQEIEYLRQVTGRLGLEFASTSRAYGQFQAATRGTAIEGQKARDVFESIAKASAVMGLSTEQTSGVLLALQQMISKGTVQAEELRGQLGERLPGAFQIAAKAMGVTTAELGKMLEQGQVIADDFLPRFARALNESLGDAAEQSTDRLDAATNRFANSWARLKEIVGDAGISSAIKGELKGLTDDITVFGETMERVGKSGGGFLTQIAAASGVEAGRLAFSLLNGSANLLNGTINTLTGNVFGLRTDLAMLPDAFKTNAQQAAALASELEVAERQFASLQARGAASSENIYLRSEYAQLGLYIERLKQAQQERLKLEQKPAYSAARDSNAASVAEAARLDGIRAAMEKVQMSLSGVKESFYRDLAALKAGYDAGLIKLSDYQAQVAKLTEQSGGGKAFSKQAEQAKREREEEAALIEKLIGLSGTYYKELEQLQGMRKRGSLTEQQYIEAVNELTKKQPFAIKLEKERADAQKASAKALEDLLTADAKYLEGLGKSASAVEEQVQKLRDEEQAARIAAASNISLAQAVQQVAIARLNEAKAKATGIGDFETAAALEREIAARRELITVMSSGEARKANEKAADDAAKAWERGIADVERSLVDNLMRGGKSVADYLEDLFRTLVLRPVIQPIAGVLAGGVSGIAGGLLGGLGLPGSAQAGSGLLGTALQAGGLMGYGGIGFGIQQGLASSLFGSANLATAGGGAAGMGGSVAGGGLSGLGSTIGAALPWIAGAALIGNALGLFRSTKTVGSGITGNLGGTVDDFEVRRKGGSLFSGPSYSTPTIGVSSFNADLQKTFDALRQNAAGFAGALGLDAEAARRFITPIGSEKLSDDTGGIGIRLEGLSAEEVSAKIQKELEAANDRLAQSVLGSAASAFAKSGETAAQTLERLAGSLAGVNGVLDALGQAAMQASAQGGAYASALLDLFGGLQQYQASAGQYLQDFYSEAERTALATRGLEQQLQALGLSVPGTREAYRQLVEAQDLSTEAGRNAYAALLQLGPTFAQLVPAVEEFGLSAKEAARLASEAAERQAEAGRRVLQNLSRDAGQLQADLLQAQGDIAGAVTLRRNQELAELLEGLNAADTEAVKAAFDLTNALRDQITATEEAAAVAAREAERARAVVQERESLEVRLLQLQGDTVGLRARELAALDPANRALQEQINALIDQQAAADKAAQALGVFKDRLAGLTDTRFDLENQLLGLQGNTAEADARTRLRDLERLTAGLTGEQAAQVTAAYDFNAALRRQIEETNNAQQAAQELADAQNRAAQDAQRAAEQFRSAWQSITDTLFDEVARIRGLLGGGGADSLASAQARFAVTTAQARAGDQEAAKLLPGLSQTLLQLAEVNAATLIDLQRIRAQVAASLEQTGTGLAGRFGLTVPRLDVGTNYVPRDMLAMIHEGEAIVPRAYNPAAGGESQGQLIEEVRQLRKQVEALGATSAATEVNTRRMKDVLVSSTHDGQAMRTVVAS